MSDHDSDELDDSPPMPGEESAIDPVPEWQQLLNDDPLPQEEDWDASESASTDADLDGAYVCDNCGEEIVIPLDIAAGRDQQYVEDCPVCCSPSVIHVHFDDSDHANVWAEAEQDRY
ncbi:CPXCG motif-containing cysteine-rich protein [Rhodopirellula sp. P2]|uniref:CPXCG motif-containing cysteine-rich protein n=1 Tax=Rhodopirellula sp. P2 TaxID=2127060 RepID=UPI0023688F59|nr:CPXCG motif-containing cysteine-rich protein [Rhodopirellula sp. P2]WDQ16873.1 CPXCG motif-containing cysteine-rich protein [Rhodopirellula sp. P2]